MPFHIGGQGRHLKYNLGGDCLRLSLSFLSLPSPRSRPPSIQLGGLGSAVRSSKVIDLGVNQKRICSFLLVKNSNFGRTSNSFRDIDTFSYKIACFPTPLLFDAAYWKNALHYQRNLYIAEKYI